jgi:NitT/TauT family transport system ATP-binding protein
VSKLLIEDVTVRFSARRGQTVTALDHISLAIPDRELSCIVGPSGCGKSTLLRLVAGLERPTSGAITLDGRAITGPSAERGMVFRATRCSRG